MSRLLVLKLILAVYIQTSFAQVIVKQQDITINSPLIQPVYYDMQARDFIRFLPGAQISADNNRSGRFYIDPFMIVPANYVSAPVSVDTRNIDTDLPVGTTPGFASVNLTGGASYNVPIEIPPGTAGVQPQLSVVYNSLAGNGLMGGGWNLAGLSVISRMGKNFYHDATVSSVNFDSGDRFALDGMRLINVSGTYRTEVESYTKITVNGVIGSSNSSFTAETKDGYIMQYGQTNDSKVKLPNTANVLHWVVNKISDRKGNYMDFIYEEDSQGAIRIKEIKYTGNTNNGLQPYNSIKFRYVTRNDIERAYIKGQQIQQEVLLDQVRIYQNNILEKTYQFNYFMLSEYSMLSEIVESAKSVKLNSTVFNYGQPAQNFQEQSTGITLGGTGGVDLLSGDFDGDGFSEILMARWNNVQPDGANGALYRVHSEFTICKRTANNSQYVQTSISLPAGNRVEKKSVPASHAFLASDYNGDGRDDILVNEISHDGIYNRINFYKVYFGNNGSIFNLSTYSPSTTYNIIHPNWKFFYPGDFDGDSRADFLTILSDGNSYKGFINMPSTGLMNVEIANINTSFINAQDIRVIDFDGDGKTELMVTWGSNSEIFSIRKNSNNTFEAISLGTFGFPSNSYAAIQSGDFNGDGKTDFLAVNMLSFTWVVVYSTGTSFTTQPFIFNSPVTLNQSEILSDKIVIADFNGDGKSDILHGRITDPTSAIDVYYSKGQSFSFKQHIYNKKLYQASVPMDANGDGKADLLNMETIFDPMDHLYFNPGSHEHLLKKISNGFGLVTEFNYLKLNSGGNFYVKDPVPSAFPLVDIQPPLYAVSALKTPDGVGGVNTINYRYKGAKLHRQAKGLLGFSSFKSINTSSNIEQEHKVEFNANFFLAVPFETIISLSSSGAFISKTEFQTSIHHFGNNRILPQPSQQIQSDYLPKAAGGDEIIVTTTNFSYYQDIFRNPQQIIVNQNNESSTTTIFQNYTTNGSWCPHVPQKVTLTSSRPGVLNVVSITDFVHNANGTLQNTLHNSGTAESLLTEYTNYDDFGNPGSINVSAPGHSQLDPRATSYEYNSRGQFVTKITNPEGHVYKATHDPLRGNLLTQTDPNNLTVTYSYDVFGHLIKTKSAAGNEAYRSLNWAAGQNGPSLALWTETVSSQGEPTQKQWYDAIGRTIRQDGQGLNGEAITAIAAFNTRGEVISRTRPKFSAEPAYNTTYSYDIRGRVTSATSPALTMQYLYDGLKISETNATTNQGVLKILNAMGEPKQVQDLAGTLTYTYSAIGQPINTQLVAGSPTLNVSYQYDQFGRQVQLNDPNAGISTYEYNAYGELTKQTDGSGNETSLIYDRLGRVTKKEFKDVNNAIDVHNYVYDNAPNSKGRIIQETAPGVIVNYVYNNLGRLSSYQKQVNGEDLIKQYEYDQKGRITKEIYPSGFSVINEFTTFGYKKRIKRGDNQQFIWTATDMNAQGQMLNWNVGPTSSGITAFNSIDNHGFMDYHQMEKSGIDLWIGSYLWDPASGNLDSRQVLNANNGPNGFNEDFTYDNLNRLKTQIGDYNMSTNFNAQGNIASKSDIGTYVYGQGGAGPHALTSVTPFVNIPIFNMDIEYNAFNKVKHINEVTSTTVNEAFFTYGTDEERVAMSYAEDGVANYTRYYCGNYEKQVNADGTIREWNYINTPSGLTSIMLIDKANVNDAGTKNLFYVVQDHLGSIAGLIDEQGNMAEEFSYDSWGRRRSATSWSDYNVNPSQLIHRGYTGHEHIDEFKIINMNGRLYDPLTGRVLSPDNYVQSPLFSQSYNRYSYTFNNPLKYTDPSGDFAVADSWLVGFVQGWFSTGSGRWSAGWNEANHRAGNDARIWGGLFATDQNKTFGGKVWEVTSRLTWQLPQTIGGFVTSHSYNTFGLGGGVESVDYLYGATVVKTRGDWGAIAQGSYIVGDNSIEANANNYLFQHEYGHYLQSQSMGFAYYPRVGIPSVLSTGTHDFHPVEQDANRRAFLYFNKNVNGFQDDTDLWNFNSKDNKGWDFYRNPLNIDGSGRREQYVNYQNTTQILSLDKIKVTSKWYDYAGWLTFPYGPIGVGLYNSWKYNR